MRRLCERARVWGKSPDLTAFDTVWDRVWIYNKYGFLVFFKLLKLFHITSGLFFFFFPHRNTLLISKEGSSPIVKKL